MLSRLKLTALCISFLLPCIGAVDPTVDLTYSTYVGTDLSNGISQWLGVRYAAPPVGNLRFAPPQDPYYESDIQPADNHGKICLATQASPTDNTTSEDCLFLDVYAPTNATVNSKLPVFFFIQGGGFNSNANPNLNGSGLIAASDYSIIVVTLNYRVGPYGFMTGPKVVANNGLRDQRKALQWVQQYISQFGGNPNHVVMGGDSAGAASVTLQLTANGGRNMHLFHASAAESQSFATVLTGEQSLYQTENWATKLGCPSPLSSSKAYLTCLRSKTAIELQTANRNIPYPAAYSQSNFTPTKAPLYMWGPTIDNDFITDYTYAAFEKGNFINVPTIFGDDTNGGTIFTPKNTSTLMQSDQFLVNQFPFLRTTDIETINELYPNPNTSCTYEGETGCYWRQVSNAYGETRYMCPGIYLSAVYYARNNHHGRHQRNANGNYNKGAPIKAYNYRYNVEDPGQIAQGLGVPHTVEVNSIFGPSNVSPGSAPKSYLPGGINAPVIPVIMGYWTSFIRTFDPNIYRYPGSARWEAWTGSPDTLDGRRLLFETGGGAVMEDLDAGLMERCRFLSSIGTDVKQ